MTDGPDDPDDSTEALLKTITAESRRQLETARGIIDESQARADAAWKRARVTLDEAAATYQRASDLFERSRRGFRHAAIMALVVAIGLLAGVATKVTYASGPTRRVCVELPSQVQHWFGPTR